MDAAFRGYKTYPQDLQPLVKFFAMYNEYIGRLYGNRFFAKGQNLILGLTGVYDMALEEFDVLVMPTLPFAAPKIPPADCSFEGRFLRPSLNNCLIKNAFGCFGCLVIARRWRNSSYRVSLCLTCLFILKFVFTSIAVLCHCPVFRVCSKSGNKRFSYV